MNLLNDIKQNTYIKIKDYNSWHNIQENKSIILVKKENYIPKFNNILDIAVYKLKQEKKDYKNDLLVFLKAFEIKEKINKSKKLKKTFNEYFINNKGII